MNLLTLSTGDAINADEILFVRYIQGDKGTFTKDRVHIQFRGDAQVSMVLEMNSPELAQKFRDEVIDAMQNRHPGIVEAVQSARDIVDNEAKRIREGESS